jgi:hypothetical protein
MTAMMVEDRPERPPSVEEALAALRAAAVPSGDPSFEPAAVVDGEQLYRKVERELVVHSMVGSIGADWSLEAAEAAVRKAGADHVLGLGWAPPGSWYDAMDHPLLVGREEFGAVAFAVTRP